ncbi:diguanylate cyclase domain-containing protein [Undibacterium pigrum]|uniref:PAS domain S-box-containing protein/diguanylate cyclase (GGDEF)-like protein n=1 Tax=Undibacterium pigrum TaxID=401470 RepID=A0A318J961_9BURK|nr:diguanylate cyclase [Undibacterium pigrum]PXX37202.1 PAS domain S-box-containing protein/diguanylate cyclase (GGDEF)-like protein [Undibacterium pigrum]
MKKNKRQLGRLERIIETQSLLAQADLDLTAFMQLVVNTLQELTEAKGAVVELVDGDYMVYRSASGSISQHVGLRLLRANSLSGLCVSSAQILRCDDAETDPRVDANACKKVGVRSMICTPLFERGQPVGVLKVMSEQANGFDEEDIQTLELMGAALGAALGKQVAFDEMLRVQMQLRASEERIRTILEYANDAVISIDNAGVVTQWNRSSESLFGWSSSEAMGRNIADLIVPPAFRNSFVNILTHLDRLGKKSTTARRELLAVDRFGKELSVEVSLNVNNIAGRFEFTAFMHDISERKKWEATLNEMALSDGLTGLPNRRHFMQVLHQAIVRQMRQNNGLALLFMDLNGFKTINDTNGHDTGDEVLKEFAKRVSGCLRGNDTMARLGGDEFVVLAEGVRVLEHAQVLARKIVTTLDQPLPGSTIMMSTSIGISIYDSAANAEQFLKEADTAMYKAKQGASSNSAIAAFVE